MRLTSLIFISLISIFNKYAYSAELFGPHESHLIYDGNRSSITFKVDNTGKMPWLVQSWVEDINESKTQAFSVIPSLFRVEPSSQFSAKVIKKNTIPEDKESIFWVVTNSLPGGKKEEEKNSEGNINAKLSLAYRFKVPMIYRPSSLKGLKKQPELLEWTVMNEERKIKVHNPTKHVMQLQYVSIKGEKKQGNGISFMIAPMANAMLSIAGNSGEKIKYGIVNDYGAIKEYEGIIDN
ncbi:TPA: molecular chaperone [Klebsiella oxytoca]